MQAVNTNFYSLWFDLQDCYGISKFLKCALHFMQCWCAVFAGVAKTSLPGDSEVTQQSACLVFESSCLMSTTQVEVSN